MCPRASDRSFEVLLTSLLRATALTLTRLEQPSEPVETGIHRPLDLALSDSTGGRVRNITDHVGERLRLARPQLQRVGRLGEPQVGVNARNYHPSIDTQELDADQRHAIEEIDHQALVEDRAHHTREATILLPALKGATTDCLQKISLAKQVKYSKPFAARAARAARSSAR